MASTAKSGLDDSRRNLGSPKLRGRENAKDTLCRNVTIYGKCRYEDKGCAFNHDPLKLQNQNQNDRKGLNVDSPSFTPTTLAANGSTPKKQNTISPKAVSAAPFLPKGPSSSAQSARSDAGSSEWSVAEIQDFVPQGFDGGQVVPLQGNGNGVLSPAPPYDPFVTQQSSIAGGSAVAPHPVPGNPYSHDAAAAVAASMGSAFFAGQTGFQQPVQYHLYAPIGPHSSNITGYQRNVHDLFLPNDFREELQKKAGATLQTLPNSSLPAHVDYFHSLVPLDLNHQKNAAIFGFPSWVYKAQSNKDGNFYVLRRLEGFRLTNEKAIRSVQAWKRITNGSVVTVHDAFTTRVFQDSSLIFVMDYHPLSKTLAEQHLGAGNRYTTRSNAHIPEQIMWSYVTQIASALKAIHSSGLAARVIDASKILLTGKNRIRLNACAIMDVVQHDTQRSIQDLQLQDLVNFGQLMLNLGVSAAGTIGSPNKAMEHFTRAYSPQLKNSVFWLLNGLQKDQERSIDIFISGISSQLISTFDSALQMDDQLTSDLSRELENGRLVRLMTKMNFVNERPEYEHDRQWSENGERYFLKLFRDYVFHQVDAQNNAVVDLGHVLNCLNKLDAGTEEKVTLISRDEQSCFVVSYKELKKALESSFQALLKPARRLH
ncbi:poly(A)-binding protein-dependent poly(A) ribonuclease, putative [Talaromyces stipitatus ATCC 10500]|uniref:PAN2-PAN3 deadenylation complex subunit PAN3 n=1 Tax=Talaromyces stipitatus (strain ATCC 10500 / CBS 375.48 / QM 6759 / NRRL 1006) TaxID=441959 RepID=B8M1V5_TALSN|nr:poly(A)-binding protein-dependent poly(A) ribonuclease, putative [Talaromyces stipitatus ATCC 10500]EED21333.1 poly(A)-binding protein-dependent poly(A) ribonuclease, putative [Talaromyces stipitatus ATCC 10500]